MQRQTSASTEQGAARHRVLRTAALAPIDIAQTAWAAWCAAADPFRFDAGSQWWFPLVWWNLRDVLPDSPQRTTLRQQYSQTWIRHQHLLAHVEPTLDALHREGIQTLLLKGAALALGTYERPGLRPFGDVDVLVKPESARAAEQVLERRGWVPFRRLQPEMQAVVPSLGYTDPHGVDLDLHRHALAECCGHEIDRGFWDRAVPIQVGAVQTLSLCPTDQLLHICAHGRRFSPVATEHWMADAIMILRRAAGTLPWDALLAEARARRLTVQLHRALSTLDPDLVQIPSSVIDALDATPVRWWERAEDRAKRTTSRPAVALLAWCTEARSRAIDDGRSIGFSARLQASSYTENPKQLAARITQAALGLRPRRGPQAFDAYGRHIQFEIQPGLDERALFAALDDRLPLLPRLSGAVSADRIYQVLQIEGLRADVPSYRVLVNREPLAIAATWEEVADYVVTDLQSFLAVAVAGRTFIHAGVVSVDGRAIVLPGASGSGKSTLVAALLRAGAIYASDEFAIVDDEGRVHAYPRPVKLRHPGGTHEYVRPRQWNATTSIEPLAAATVLFAPFRPDAQFSPRALSPSAAMLRLLAHCPGAQGRPAETMAGLRALLQAAPAFVAERGDTDSVVQALMNGKIVEAGFSPPPLRAG